jgi:hypothetical protein
MDHSVYQNTVDSLPVQWQDSTCTNFEIQNKYKHLFIFET